MAMFTCEMRLHHGQTRQLRNSSAGTAGEAIRLVAGESIYPVSAEHIDDLAKAADNLMRPTEHRTPGHIFHSKVTTATLSHGWSTYTLERIGDDY